jgi:L-iditol 2-dehydrogenase
MRAAVLIAPGAVKMADLALPSADDGVRVRLLRGGLCGTDHKIVSGDIVVAYPRILGHEVFGVVDAPFPGGPASGTRVIVDPCIACGVCASCRNDRANLCPNGALMGRDVDGGFADVIVVPVNRLHPVPDAVSDDAGPLLQILATCVHAQSRLAVFPGQRAMIIGLGVAGLLHLQLLWARGITDVIGVDLSADKRARAADLGVRVTEHPVDIEERVAQMAEADRPSLVIECVGKAATIGQAVRSAALGAQILCFGTGTTDGAGIPLYDWYFKELTLLNARASLPRDFAVAAALVTSGQINVADLVTAVRPLDDIAAALVLAHDPDQLKVILRA